MPVDVLHENETFVSELRKAIRSGTTGLSDVPMLLKVILEEGRWKERRLPSGKVVPFDRFEDFVTTRPIEGLGADMALIRRICAGDAEAVDLLDRALQREPCKHVGVGLIQSNTSQPARDRSTQSIRRLRKDYPDLHAKVVAGETTTYRAAVEVGIYPRRVSVSLASAESACRSLARLAPPEFLRELGRKLMEAARP